MTLRALIAAAKDRLQQAGVEDAPREARWLLSHFSGLSDADIIAGAELPVTFDASAFDQAIARRCAGEPLSKIIGLRGFYGRDFITAPCVLDPRPDTEILVASALSCLRDTAAPRLLELGVGSSCVITTLLAECPAATALGVDISPDALAIAEQNAARHGVTDRLTLCLSAWFTNVTERFDLIVSNPPYIPSADIAGLDVAVRDHDPHLALDGGADGLNAYRIILANAPLHMTNTADLLFEIGAGQADAIADIARTHGFTLKARHHDLGGHTRVLHFTLDSGAIS